MGSQLAKAASKELELQQALQAERNSRDQERTLLTSRETSREASEIASVHNELSSLRGQLASLTQVSSDWCRAYDCHTTVAKHCGVSEFQFIQAYTHSLTHSLLSNPLS